MIVGIDGRTGIANLWIYAQSTGELFQEDGDAPSSVAVGYSGHGEGKNNAALQGVHDVGPIPRGFWAIGDPQSVETVGPHGPFVLPLTPIEGTNTEGRSGFLIHGDSFQQIGAASHGCIVINRHVREAIAASHDQLLKVVA